MTTSGAHTAADGPPGQQPQARAAGDGDVAPGGDDGLPRYADLLRREDAPPGSAWGLFGERDDLGTVNFLTPERVKAAAALVRRGDVIGLDLALDAIAVPMVAHRKGLEHTLFSNGSSHRDDHVALYSQAATHFDGLRHVRHHEHGYYGGAAEEDVEAGRRLGIDHWARTGIVGRGILLDVPRYLAAAGEPPLDQTASVPLSPELLDRVLAAQDTERRPGDVVLLRTGWLAHYFSLNAEQQVGLRGKMATPGIEQSHDMLAWLWDHRVAAIVADNPALECLPPTASSPFHVGVGDATGLAPGLVHTHLIALLGLAVGELWNLEPLADDCARDGVYEALFVSKPLNVTGGAGAPANAIAIK